MGQAESKDNSRQRAGIFFHDVSKEDLKPGDHIYCYRGGILYSHHGIYIGEPDCEVIHFSGNKMSSACVRKDSLEVFLAGAQLRLVAYNASFIEKILKKSESSHCKKSVPANVAIITAKYYLHHPDKWEGYNLLWNNCETFALHCKLGITIDIQGQGFRLKGLNIIGGLLSDVYEAVTSQDSEAMYSLRHILENHKRFDEQLEEKYKHLKYKYKSGDAVEDYLSAVLKTHTGIN